MPISFKSIQEEYDVFMQAIFAKTEIDQVRYDEMRRAFFAGASLMCQVANEIAESHVSEAEAIAYINARSREMVDFKNRLLRKQAERN